jgi:CRISPR-associated protein Cmr4
VKNILAVLFKVNIEDIALFSDTFFTAICEDAIPVVTRNKIDDEGMSENLFYEEVLPRRSKLSFILGEENGKLGDNYNKFVSSITGSEASIQVGGNYSIGYGFSKITKL